MVAFKLKIWKVKFSFAILEKKADAFGLKKTQQNLKHAHVEPHTHTLTWKRKVDW